MKTDIIVVGGGGREHALIKALKKSPEIGVIYALPGNGGMAADAICVPEIGAKEIDKIVAFATSHNIGFAVVAPDDPLVLGCADALIEAGIPTFGPKKNAAIIEGSKVFAKNLMKKYGIPTAAYETFDDAEAALAYVESCAIPTVVKADGLALGKGVIIAMTREEAIDAVRSIMEDKAFGESGSRIVIEEFLTGPEVSVLSFTDGKTVIPMISSMDHKRIGDHDTGLNTGGMGTVAPNPYYTDEIADVCMKEIFLPTIRAMEAEGRPFAGCLYFGLMLTPTGPKVIEYNCRFGDPETQVVLPLLDSDLFTIMKACAEGTLTQDLVKWKNGHACCVVLASNGYPVKYQSGFEITVQDGFEAELYVAGAKLQDGKLLTAGGRVLGVTAVADTLENAIAQAYKNADLVSFEGAYRRSDIGQRALAAGQPTMDDIISLLNENKELPSDWLGDALFDLIYAGATYINQHKDNVKIPIFFDETIGEEDIVNIDWTAEEFRLAASAVVAFNYLLPQMERLHINEQITGKYIDEDKKKLIDFLKDERESLSEAEFLNKYKGITLQKMCGKEIFAQKDEIDTEKEHYIIVSKDPETGSFRFKFN